MIKTQPELDFFIAGSQDNTSHRDLKAKASDVNVKVLTRFSN